MEKSQKVHNLIHTVLKSHITFLPFSKERRKPVRYLICHHTTALLILQCLLLYLKKYNLKYLIFLVICFQNVLFHFCVVFLESVYREKQNEVTDCDLTNLLMMHMKNVILIPNHLISIC